MIEVPITLKELVTATMRAGALLRDGNRSLFQQGKVVKVAHKADDTPVTEVDHAINLMMKQFADGKGLGLIGEEGNGETDREFILYVDPVDGTEAFIRGMNTATVIATVMKMENGYGLPVMAVIYEPISGHIWASEAGQPTLYGNSTLRSNPHQVETAFPTGKIKTAICLWPDASHNLVAVSADIIADPRFDDQQMGAFGYGAGLIASGIIHVTACGATAATEAAAMMLVVKGAGGIASDLNGNPLRHFRLSEVRGKVDFELPNGALFTSCAEVSLIILKKVREANQ